MPDRGKEAAMIKPSFETVKALAEERNYKTLPVSTEMLSDIRTPIEVLRILKKVSSHCYILESAADAERWGRYTFLGYDPKLEITCCNGKIKVGSLTFDDPDPDKYIRQVLREYKSPRFDDLPSFTGGLVGYFSYDYLKYAEPSLHLDAKDTEQFKDVDVMLFDKVIAFDNLRQKIILIVNISLENPESEYIRAKQELQKMAELIKGISPEEEPAGILKSEFTPTFDQLTYCEMVEKAKNHIKEGDIFQIVLSNRLEADFEGSLINTYRILRAVNPSPYLFYFSSSDMEVAGASPETLVKLEDRTLHTFPLAGTRPRGKSPEEDNRLKQELLSDPKELSEHNMLVDLGRNDLGKVSCFGSIQVEKFHSIERFSHVMHLASTVRGQLSPDKDALDALSAVLPAGTLSGAPKLKACQLINDLEKNKRGIYGGAIGYLDFTGNMDTCIAIRIAYKKNGKVYVRSGAGIVADSVPEKEYQECLNKAAAVINALKRSEEADR